MSCLCLRPDQARRPLSYMNTCIRHIIPPAVSQRNNCQARRTRWLFGIEGAIERPLSLHSRTTASGRSATFMSDASGLIVDRRSSTLSRRSSFAEAAVQAITLNGAPHLIGPNSSDNRSRSAPFLRGAFEAHITSAAARYSSTNDNPAERPTRSKPAWDF